MTLRSPSWSASGAEDGDIVFFGADKTNVVNEALGALRIKIGHDLDMLTSEWAPLWVVDFPMFEETSGRRPHRDSPPVHRAFLFSP